MRIRLEKHTGWDLAEHRGSMMKRITLNEAGSVELIPTANGIAIHYRDENNCVTSIETFSDDEILQGIEIMRYLRNSSQMESKDIPLPLLDRLDAAAYTSVLKFALKLEENGLITQDQICEYLGISYQEFINLCLTYISKM